MAPTKVALSAGLVNYRLGIISYRKGDLDGAIEAWIRALKFEPNNMELRKALEMAQKEKEGRGSKDIS